MSYEIEPTEYKRDLPPHHEDYAWAGKLPGDDWIVCCTMGPSFLWDPDKDDWVCSTVLKRSTFPTMSKEAALELLRTLMTKKRMAGTFPELCQDVWEAKTRALNLSDTSDFGAYTAATQEADRAWSALVDEAGGEEAAHRHYHAWLTDRAQKIGRE